MRQKAKSHKNVEFNHMATSTTVVNIAPPSANGHGPANPVQGELKLVEDLLRTVAQVKYNFLADILDAIVTAGGKRLRPSLLLLSAKFYNYDIEHLVPVAAAIELLHTATLVHDDTIDDSLLRRGKPTLNSIFSNGATVLTGDYLFAHAASLSTRCENIRAVRIFADSLVTIMDGELGQIAAGRSPERARENYYARIYAKTASLFEAACHIGAVVAQAPEEAIVKLGRYGRQMGMAFQVVDDILDFQSTTADLGKPVGNDLRQGTVTLPAMYFLDEAHNEADRQLVRSVIEGKVENEEQVNRAVILIKDSNALEMAYRQARLFANEAKQAIADFPHNEARQAMETIADFTVARDK